MSKKGEHPDNSPRVEQVPLCFLCMSHMFLAALPHFQPNPEGNRPLRQFYAFPGGARAALWEEITPAAL